MSKIVICHCNRPEFLEIQIEAYEKMCKDLSEIIIFNDGSSEKLRRNILDISSNKNVRCVDVPVNIDHSSAPIACAAVLQWAYDFLLNSGEKDQFAFLDSDMFPISEFKISDYLQGEISFSALRQDRGNVDYPWNGIFFIDFSRVPHPRAINWYCGVVKGNNVDCGGLTHLYFEKYGRNHFRYLTHTSHLNMKSISQLRNCPQKFKNSYNENFKIEVIDEVFLHYGSASNWQTAWLSPKDFNVDKTQFVKSWLKEVGAIL